MRPDAGLRQVQPSVRAGHVSDATPPTRFCKDVRNGLRTSPLVSVVVPCFQSAAYLPETLSSIGAQEFRDYEVVLVDDGSTDDTVALVRAFIAGGLGFGVRLLCQPNAGLAAARNTGVAAARGRFILPLDADDLIAPRMLGDCIAVFEADPGLDIVYPDRRDFGDIEGIAEAGRFELPRLRHFNQLPYCSLYRRALWNDIGGYRTNVSGFDDWDFWVAAATRGARAARLDQPHFLHRRRRSSLMWSLLPDYERLYSKIMLNNPGAYTPAELEIARDHLEMNKPSPMAARSRFVFLGNYYRGYPQETVEK